MRKLAEIDTIEFIDDEDSSTLWGSRRRYPTKEDFQYFLHEFGFEEVILDDIREGYIRRLRKTQEYDMRWESCIGPARGASAVWEWLR